MNTSTQFYTTHFLSVSVSASDSVSVNAPLGVFTLSEIKCVFFAFVKCERGIKKKLFVSRKRQFNLLKLHIVTLLRPHDVQQQLNSFKNLIRQIKCHEIKYFPKYNSLFYLYRVTCCFNKCIFGGSLESP